MRNLERLVRRSIAMVAVGFAVTIVSATLVVAETKTAYPEPPTGTPVSRLVIENTMSASALSLSGGMGLVITLDGFSLLTEEKLKRGGLQFGKKYVPKGESSIAITVGSHSMVHTVELPGGNGLYHFRTAEMAFETEEGKTYRMKFRKAGTMMKPTYAIEYEGWSSEQIAQWPSEVGIGDLIFSR